MGIRKVGVWLLFMLSASLAKSVDSDVGACAAYNKTDEIDLRGTPCDKFLVLDGDLDLADVVLFGEHHSYTNITHACIGYLAAILPIFKGAPSTVLLEGFFSDLPFRPLDQPGDVKLAELCDNSRGCAGWDRAPSFMEGMSFIMEYRAQLIRAVMFALLSSNRNIKGPKLREEILKRIKKPFQYFATMGSVGLMDVNDHVEYVLADFRDHKTRYATDYISKALFDEFNEEEMGGTLIENNYQDWMANLLLTFEKTSAQIIEKYESFLFARNEVLIAAILRTVSPMFAIAGLRHYYQGKGVLPGQQVRAVLRQEGVNYAYLQMNVSGTLTTP